MPRISCAQAALTGVVLTVTLFRRPRRVPESDTAAGAATADVACRELVDLVTGYLDRVLPPDRRAGFEDHLAGCAGCSECVRQIRLTIEALPLIDDTAGGT